MSHFTVMVFGADPEALLAPYDENISVDEYDEGPVTKEEKDLFMKHYRHLFMEHYRPQEKTENGAEYKKDYTEEEFKEMYNMKGDDWNGGFWRNNKEGVLTSYSNYNPNSKWDWYSLGGRWGGFLQLKQGARGKQFLSIIDAKAYGEQKHYSEYGRVDQAYKREIDFDLDRNDAARKAKHRWETIHELMGDAEWISWHKFVELSAGPCPADVEERAAWQKNLGTVREQFSQIDMNKRLHPKILSAAGIDVSPFCDLEKEYNMPLEKYVDLCRARAIATFALITSDGKWHESGSMGWFGVTSDNKDETEWAKFVQDQIDKLSDDTLISIYDCHI